MKIELLKEPLIEFGNDFLSDDPKLGLSIGGFFSSTNKGHRSEIHLGMIGTNENLEQAIDWIKQFESPIESIASKSKNKKKYNTRIENGEVIDYTDEESWLFAEEFEAEKESEDEISEPINKLLNPDFIGFNEETNLKCCFVNDDTNNKSVKFATLNEILKNTDYNNFDKAVKICDLYIKAYEDLLVNNISTKPDICIIVIPSNVFKKLSSIKYNKKGQNFNLRRYLKAQLLIYSSKIPVQIILEDTLTKKKKSLQDMSMQAWNFIVSSYYKNNCTPWTLTLKDKDTCFIGISFHKVLNEDSNLIRSSIAQAFNYEGKGIVFIGKPFEWDMDKMDTPAPHLSYSYAMEMIVKVIKQYKKINRNQAPARVVVHKTTDFWNTAINKDYAEVEGLKDGIRDFLGEDVEIDLVTIKNSSIKLFRERGKYPVMRGTLIHQDRATGILYTTGYIPYYETYPGLYVPHPLEVSIYEGESTLRTVCEEILALTKLNFNNCNYYDSYPITIRFSQKVGEIVQYSDNSENLPNQYYYYM
jgi:hypothetical protein